MGKAWTCPHVDGQTEYSPCQVLLCIWWKQLRVVYYELLKPSETITVDRYRTHMKRPQYEERHDKVIFQHDNAQSDVARPVKTYLETLKWDVLPHLPYSFRSYKEVKKLIELWIASKEALFSQDGIRQLPERWKKVVASDG